MKVQPYSRFVCPLDGAVLESTTNGASCGAGHHFDRAREGYLNLLPVQHKASRQPGDDQAMVVARRCVLDSGLFAPLAAAVFDTVHGLVAECHDERSLRIVDAGCGEGYYLERLLAAARACDAPGSLALAGFDISKLAVRAAARRSHDVAWAVASNRQPPFLPASCDLILSLFGFPHWPGFAAVLAPRGHVLLVEAGATHLLELREVIYPQIVAQASSVLDAAVMRGWAPVVGRNLEYHVTLTSSSQIAALLGMTPHAHRMTADGRAALAQLSTARVTLSVSMWLLQKPSTNDPGCECLTGS